METTITTPVGIIGAQRAWELWKKAIDEHGIPSIESRNAFLRLEAVRRGYPTYERRRKVNIELKTQQEIAKARDLFADGHWYQGNWIDPETEGSDEPNYCTLGALRSVIFGLKQDPTDIWMDELVKSRDYWQCVSAIAIEIAPDLANEVLVNIDYEDDESKEKGLLSLEAIVATWNDDMNTTSEDVLRILDQALANA